MLHLLSVCIFGVFSTGVYALNPIEVQSNTVEDRTRTMLERQEQNLKWIKTLKNSILEKTEPYLGAAEAMQAEAMQTEAYFKKEDFQCGCSASKNHFPEMLLHQEADIFNTLSPASLKSKSNAEVYIFVSLSMPKPALIALNREAAQLGATLVLRGLKENSYQKTALYLQEIIAKTGQGFLIHPELFKRYEILHVPSVVLTIDPLGREAIFDVVSGHIPIKTALLKIAEQGDLKNEAKAWLLRDAYAD